MLEELWSWIRNISPFLLIFLVIRNWTEVKLFFTDILGAIGSIWAFWDKIAVKRNIEEKITSYSKDLNKELGDILPRNIKIEWQKIENESEKSFIEHDEVVVKMGKYKDIDKNLALATSLYISKGFLPRAKIYLKPNFKKSMDLFMTNKVLKRWQRSSVVHYFDEVLDPAIEEDPEIKYLINDINKIDEIGMFTHVLIQEIKYMGESLYPNIPTEDIKKEAKNALIFLKNIALKSPDEEVNLLFEGSIMSFAIVIVAKLDTIADHGLGAHKRRVRKLINKGVNSIYLSAFERNKKLAKEVAYEFKYEERVNKIDKKPYKITRTDNKYNEGVYYVLSINNTS